MKIDFYAPKKYYGTHILAFGGWITLLAFLYFLPPCKQYSSDSSAGIVYGLVSLIPLDFLFAAIIVYVLEFLYNSNVKINFILANNFYDLFFDFGLLCCFLPVFWFYICFDFRLIAVGIFFLIFLIIRLLKYLQRKFEKKNTLNSKEETV